MNKSDLELLAKEYGQKISALSRRMIKNEDTAKDAAQEAWYEIVKSIDSFSGP